jgi:hypothetical protein
MRVFHVARQVVVLGRAVLAARALELRLFAAFQADVRQQVSAVAVRLLAAGTRESTFVPPPLQRDPHGMALVTWKTKTG